MFSFVRSRSRRRPAAGSPQRLRSWQPRLEILEDRVTPTTVLSIEPDSTISSYAGVGFQQNAVAGLSGTVNGLPDVNPNDFTAQINWGDSTGFQNASLAVNNGGGEFSTTFLVKGSHVYSTVGSYMIEVQATGPGGTTSQPQQVATAEVSNMPSGIDGITPPAVNNPLGPSNVTVSIEPDSTLVSYAGVGFQENAVAGLSGTLNAQTDTHKTDFHAFINWGDSNQWFAADIASNQGGGAFSTTFILKASHVYAVAGSYHIVVYAMGADGTSRTLETSTGEVSNMSSGIPGTQPPPLATPLGPSNVTVTIEPDSTITPTAGVPFQQVPVAGMSGTLNAQVDNHAGDFQAFINWGDSAQWFLANVVPNTGGGQFSTTFVVQGNHVYNQAGTYPIVVFAIGPDGTSETRETGSAQVGPNPNPSAWQAKDVAVGSDGQARVLWRTPSGLEDVWKVSNSVQTSAGPIGGGLSGWTPIADAAGGDGLSRILWMNTSGAAALWLVNSSGSLQSSQVFGPFGSWDPVDVTVGSDNATRILWDNSNGQAVVWRVDDSFNVTSSVVFGAFPGWTATKISAGADGLVRLLWNNTNGSASLWLLNANGSYNNSAVFGAIQGWTATDVAAGSDGQSRILWSNGSGSAAIWQVNNSFTVTAVTLYSAPSGWNAVALAAGSDGVIRLLWDNTSGAASLWVLANNGTYEASGTWGPF
jgi:hypothetical protein